MSLTACDTDTVSSQQYEMIGLTARDGWTKEGRGRIERR